MYKFLLCIVILLVLCDNAQCQDCNFASSLEFKVLKVRIEGVSREEAESLVKKLIGEGIDRKISLAVVKDVYETPVDLSPVNELKSNYEKRGRQVCENTIRESNTQELPIVR